MTYKVHLDGYDQTNMITGKGPSNRHEIFYFGESTWARCGSTTSSIASSNSLAAGWAQDSADVPFLINLRLDPFERTGWPEIVTNGRRNTSTGSSTNSGVSCSSRSKSRSWPDRDRIPADAEGRELQPRCRESEDRGSPGRDGKIAKLARPRHSGCVVVRIH